MLLGTKKVSGPSNGNAYFMYEQQKILNEVSEKRLEAIKDFTELGSGFNEAMLLGTKKVSGPSNGKVTHRNFEPRT
jgi:hypothetical protein